MSQHLLLGTDHIKVAKVYSEEPQPDIVMATTAGRKQSIQKKQDINEDAAAVITVPEGTLIMVADSHYGARAAHIAVEFFERFWNESDGPIMRRLRYVHYMIDRQICAERRQVGTENFHTHCATTLVSGLLDGDRITLVSSGDSRAWAVRDGEVDDLLRQDEKYYFLGDRDGLMSQAAELMDYHGILSSTTERNTVLKVLLILCEIHQQVINNLATRSQVERLCKEIETITGNPLNLDVAALLEPWHELHLVLARLTPQVASHRLDEGDVLLLATDGIDEHESAVDERQIVKLLTPSRKSLLKRTHKLVDATTGRRGGNDNVMVVTVQF